MFSETGNPLNFYLLPAAILFLDALLGEPPNAFHPVAWLGHAAAKVEKICRRRLGSGVGSGLAAWMMLTLLPASAIFFLVRLVQHYGGISAGFTAAVGTGYFTVALRSLTDHSRRIREPLRNGDLSSARKALSMIVSRDTSFLDESGIVRGGVESIGENLIDAVTSALFWIAFGYVCAGFPGAAAGGVFLRCVNTLDACWGYRNERYFRFGRVAARTDDWMHFIPARMTLAAIALAAPLMGGSPMQTLETGWKHRKDHPSPNSCYGMAGFAGALRIRLGGPTLYPDGMEQYPCWGNGREKLNWKDLLRAEWLARFSALIFSLMLWGLYALCRISCRGL